VEYPNFLESPQPAIDRTSKPQFGGKGSLFADNANMMQVATPDGVNVSHPVIDSFSSDRTKDTVRPGVNRESKAAALQTYEKRSWGVSELPYAERVKRAQALEESQLKAEKEQEILRISKEKEAEEERVRLLQTREEELILNITNLTEHHKAQVNSSSCLS
jgi:hypothetical protein